MKSPHDTTTFSRPGGRWGPSVAFVSAFVLLMALSLQFSEGSLSANTQDEACTASAQNLNDAKADYSNSCTEPRVDCDQLNGLWVCSSQVIGDAAPGGITAPVDTEVPETPGTACTATAATLNAAKAAYSSSCVEPRQDCDPINGEWVCSSEKIGANAPTTSEAPETSTTEPPKTTTAVPETTTAAPETTTVAPTTTTTVTNDCVANTSGVADLSNDLISLQYDHAPDKDDGHATAAGKEISTALDLDPWVVGGAYGADNANSYNENSEAVMDAVWGAGNWVNADADWPLAVQETADAWQATLVDCGDIWIAEGGQSDLSADVVRELQDRMPNLDTTERIHLIQHSGWNERMALDADLAFVQQNTDYQKIPDGNGGGNGTADFNAGSYDGPFNAAVLAGPNGAGWQAAFNYLPTSDKLDFSDTVELMHIIGVGVDEVADHNDFVDVFIGAITPVPTTTTTTTTTAAPAPTTTVAPTPTTTAPTSGAFIESNGVVTIETTSLDVPTEWRQFPSEAGNDPIRPGATDGEYIQWGGGNDFANPGRGAFTIPVEITEPGRYRFIWHSATGIGTQSSEHNDSWLRINADSFYGEKPNSIVCPTGTPNSNRCDGNDPEGRSADGWFKIYRSGTPSDGFKWQSATSDSDAHAVYVEFDSVGTYEIEISGRSDGHAIDRIVLYRDGNDDNNVSNGDATNLNNPESARR